MLLLCAEVLLFSFLFKRKVNGISFGWLSYTYLPIHKCVLKIPIGDVTKVLEKINILYRLGILIPLRRLERVRVNIMNNYCPTKTSRDSCSPSLKTKL